MQRVYVIQDTHEYVWGRNALASVIGCSPQAIYLAQKRQSQEHFVVRNFTIKEVPFAPLKNERWVKVSKHYKVSSCGRVARITPCKKDRLVTPFLLPSGYEQVSLCENGKRKPCFVHRLVAEAFIPNPKQLPHINHKNKIKTDNRVENLEWCNCGYNNKHARYFYLPMLEIKKIADNAINNPNKINVYDCFKKIVDVVKRETGDFV